MDNRELRFCPRCGAITPKYGSECRNCGYSFVEEETAEEIIDSSNSYEEEKTNSEETVNTEETKEYYEETKAETAKQKPSVNEEPKKKKKNLLWLWILLIAIPIVSLIAIIIILVCVLLYMCFNNFSQLNPNPNVSPTPSVTQGADDDDDYTYTNFKPHISDRRAITDFDMSLYSSIASEYDNKESSKDTDPFMAETDPEGIFGSHDMEERSNITGPYYEPFYESFDDSYGYTYERRFINYADNLSGINIDADVAYYQFDGNITNLDELNEELYYEQCYDLIQYIRGKSSYGESTSIYFKIDSYISYNDAEKLSIVSNVKVYTDGQSDYIGDMYIYGINVDLVNGRVMYNPDILDLDTVASEFRQKSDAQNGVADTLAAMTDEEIKTFLNDDSSLIVFFTPVGVEVGFGYKYNYGGIGWITVSYDDYDSIYTYNDNSQSVKIAPAEGYSNIDVPDNNTEDAVVPSEDPLSDFYSGSDDL